MTRATLPLEADIVAPSAWTAADIAMADWRLPVTDACCRELRDALDWWRANPLPVELLDTAAPALPSAAAGTACSACTARTT